MKRLLTLESISNIIRRFPGSQRFGLLAFTPVFFVFGAAFEFVLIHWHVRDISFCMILFLIFLEFY